MSLYIVGILNEDGSINNALSIKRLAEVAVAYARAGRTNRAVCISMKNIEMRNGVVFILVRLSRAGSVGYDGQQSGSHKDRSVRGWTGRKGKCYVCTIMCIVVMRRLFCRLR